MKEDRNVGILNFSVSPLIYGLIHYYAAKSGCTKAEMIRGFIEQLAKCDPHFNETEFRRYMKQHIRTAPKLKDIEGIDETIDAELNAFFELNETGHNWMFRRIRSLRPEYVNTEDTGTLKPVPHAARK